MQKTCLIFLLLAITSSFEHVAAQASKPQSLTKVTDTKSPPSSIRNVPTNEVNPEAKRLYDAGISLSQTGALPQAAENFQQAIRIDNQYAEAYSALGRTYFKMRQWEKAIDTFRRASELNTKQRAEEARLQKLQQQRPRQVATNTSPKQVTPQVVTRNATETRPVPTRPPAKRAQQLPTLFRATVSNLPPPRINPPQTTSAGVVAMKAVLNESPPTRNAVRPVGTSGVPQAVTRNVTETRPLPTRAPAKRAQQLPNFFRTTARNIPQPRINPPQATGASTVAVKALLNESPPTRTAVTPVGPSGARVSLNVTPPPVPVEPKTVTPIPTKPASPEVSLSSLYHVGPGDVLDIRLNDSPSPTSTLFTVTPAGLLEHPLFPQPLPVSGLPVEEIGIKIEADLMNRAVIENPKVVVTVRDYASHAILVSGLVKDPGTKFLRREAIPLYVVVADAQPLPEAARVTIVRDASKQIYEVDLAQVADMNLLVRPGDVITLGPNVNQFVYIGGDVKFPGEKQFRRGLTLTQAILTTGVSPKAKFAQIGRDNGAGFVVATRFNLQEIEGGKAADPLLKPGDRITILR